jgi:hypothetical protein
MEKVFCQCDIGHIYYRKQPLSVFVTATTQRYQSIYVNIEQAIEFIYLILAPTPKYANRTKDHSWMIHS